MLGIAGGILLGLLVGSSIGLALFLHPVVLGETRIAWTYWIPIAAACSFAIACIPIGGSRPTRESKLGFVDGIRK